MSPIKLRGTCPLKEQQLKIGGTCPPRLPGAPIIMPPAPRFQRLTSPMPSRLTLGHADNEREARARRRYEADLDYIRGPYDSSHCTECSINIGPSRFQRIYALHLHKIREPQLCFKKQVCRIPYDLLTRTILVHYVYLEEKRTFCRGLRRSGTARTRAARPVAPRLQRSFGLRAACSALQSEAGESRSRRRRPADARGTRMCMWCALGSWPGSAAS